MKNVLFAAVALAAVGFSSAATAGEFFVGALKHDVTFVGEAVGSGAAGRESGVDLHLGVRSDRIESLGFLGRPQTHLRLSINSEGTSNFVAAGLNWPIALGDSGFYLRPGMGIAYTDGEVDLPPVNQPGISQAEIDRRLVLYNTRIDFGSKVLFEPELAFGYNLTDRTSIELTYTHLSTGQIFNKGKNQGLDDFGASINFKF